MKVIKKENEIEQVRGERESLDNTEVFLGNALGGFRGRFLFYARVRPRQVR